MPYKFNKDKIPLEVKVKSMETQRLYHDLSEINNSSDFRLAPQ